MRRRILLKSGSRLPKGFTELAYIESTGTQHIDTGIVLNGATDEVEIDMYWTKALNNANEYIWGSGGTLTNDAKNFYFRGTSNKFNVNWSGSLNELSPTYHGRYLVNLSFKDGSVTINNEVVYTASPSSNTTRFNVCICGYKQGTTTVVHSSIKVFEYKMWRSNVLTQHLIPAMRDSDSEIGLYDLVNGDFLVNAGTGTFNYAPLFSSAYTELAYLQSSGTQYFTVNPSIQAGDFIAAGGKMMSVATSYSRDLYIFGGSVTVFSARFTGFTNDSPKKAKYSTTINSSTSEAASLDTGVEVTFELSTLGVTVNGTFTSNERALSNTINYFGVFRAYNNNYRCPVRFYNFYIQHRNTMLYDLVPAMRNSDSEVGMYDMRGHDFYTNAGTGTFLYA